MAKFAEGQRVLVRNFNGSAPNIEYHRVGTVTLVGIPIRFSTSELLERHYLVKFDGDKQVTVVRESWLELA
ncbi:MAG: hypothetical protein ACE5JL_00525 [Dehalococcoidia bacterium]